MFLLLVSFDLPLHGLWAYGRLGAWLIGQGGNGQGGARADRAGAGAGAGQREEPAGRSERPYCPGEADAEAAYWAQAEAQKTKSWSAICGRGKRGRGPKRGPITFGSPRGEGTPMAGGRAHNWREPPWTEPPRRCAEQLDPVTRPRLRRPWKGRCSAARRQASFRGVPGGLSLVAPRRASNGCSSAAQRGHRQPARTSTLGQQGALVERGPVRRGAPGAAGAGSRSARVHGPGLGSPPRSALQEGEGAWGWPGRGRSARTHAAMVQAQAAQTPAFAAAVALEHKTGSVPNAKHAKDPSASHPTYVLLRCALFLGRQPKQHYRAGGEFERKLPGHAAGPVWGALKPCSEDLRVGAHRLGEHGRERSAGAISRAFNVSLPKRELVDHVHAAVPAMGSIAKPSRLKSRGRSERWRRASKRWPLEAATWWWRRAGGDGGVPPSFPSWRKDILGRTDIFEVPDLRPPEQVPGRAPRAAAAALSAASAASSGPRASKKKIMRAVVVLSLRFPGVAMAGGKSDLSGAFKLVHVCS